MKQLWIFLAGVVTGLAVAAILLAVGYKSWSEEKSEFGRHLGYVDGAIAVIDFLDKAAMMPSSEAKTVHFDIKDVSLSVVRTSGFRTLRIDEIR